MLGEPALVAGHHAGDAQRVALLAQQRVAAVPGAVATRSRGSPGSGRCTSSRCTATRTSAWPGLERRADRVQRRHEVGVVAHRRRAPSAPIRVMIRIDATTYGLSVISTPNIGFSASSGPMQNGMTYIVRPRMQPRYSSVMRCFISAGAIQLLVGPASASSTEQMKVRSSTRATSDGSVRAQNEFGLRSGSSGTSVPAATSSSVSRSHSSVGAVAPHDPVRGGQLGDLAHPGEQPRVPGRRARCRRSSHGVELTLGGRGNHGFSSRSTLTQCPTRPLAAAA